MTRHEPRPRSQSLRRLAVPGILTALAIVGCGSNDDGAAESAAPDSDAPAALPADATWQWQLQGDITTDYDVDVYDIDLFDAPPATIDQLHVDGRIVICYFSAGSFEEWREDAAAFDGADLGEALDGWEGERWLDVRSTDVRDIMSTRLDLAVDKDCDGVEPDNVDAHDNDSGFDLTASEQLDFNGFLASAAHDRDLLIGLKNALSLIPELVDEYDFAVSEQCHEYRECGANQPFIDAGKPVFNAEYATEFVDDPDALCAAATAAGTRSLILPRDLDDSFRIACD